MAALAKLRNYHHIVLQLMIMMDE